MLKIIFLNNYTINIHLNCILISLLKQELFTFIDSIYLLSENKWILEINVKTDHIQFYDKQVV